MGDLQGNEFRIVLRDVPNPREEIDQAMHALQARGFLNYFGMQRFGKKGVMSRCPFGPLTQGQARTHEIGIALLRSDWAAATELIMRPREGESADVGIYALGAAKLTPQVTEARRKWVEEGDADAALSGLPPSFTAERTVVNVLKRQGANSHCNAIQAVGTGQAAPS